MGALSSIHRARSKGPLRVAVAMAVAAMAASVGPAGAAARTPWDTNLLKNPGFENGEPSSDGYEQVPIPYWYHDAEGFVTVVKYGQAGGFPTRAESRRISGGQHFLSGGPEEFGDCGYTGQTVHITGRAAAIDSGHVRLKVTARLGTYDSQTDTAYLAIGNEGGLASLGSLSRTATNERLLAVSFSTILPPGTRLVRLDFTTLNHGGYCDGYADKMVLKLIHV